MNGNGEAEPAVSKNVPWWSRLGPVAVCLVVVVTMWVGLVRPIISAVIEKTQRTQCMRNMSEIGKLINEWGVDNDRCPAKLEDIGSKLEGINLAIFVCPATGHKAGPRNEISRWTDYVIVSETSVQGVTNAVPSAANAAILVCRPGNHKAKGFSVLFNDGSVCWYRGEDIDEVLKAEDGGR
jgi:hypothetical protein